MSGRAGRPASAAHDAASGRDWTTYAACATRPELPWIVDAAHVSPWDAVTMRAVCAGCPVLFDCLNAVDDLDVVGGWWAGHDRDPHAVDPAPVPAWVAPLPWLGWEPVRLRCGRQIASQAVLVLAGFLDRARVA